MIKEIYDIGGMHCAACSSAVERVTRKLNGVISSEVNLPLNKLTITYDENLCKSEDIIKKIERAGFTAKIHSENKNTNFNDNKKDTEKKLKYKKISIILSTVFAGIILIISMGQMLFPNMPIPDIINMNTHPVNFAIIQMLFTILVLFLGKHFFVSGFNSLIHGNPNMDTLVAISATASFLYSLVMTFSISDIPHSVHNLYFESAAMVVALVSIGKFMEESNKEKTKDAIKKLMELTPDTAILVDDNGQWEVPTDMLKINDTVLIKAGEKVPLDAIVINGNGTVDESMLTGESMPIAKTIDSKIIGGSIVKNGVLYAKIIRIGNDTTLSKIIKFVEDAQGKKAPISRVADKVAGVFVPIVILIAIVSAIIWLLVGKEFSFALKIFTTILVIACPCAMGLATPTAIIVGTGLGANNGILIRNGEALEITHNVTTAIFDKTGTITEGKPTVTDIIAENENEILEIAYSVEKLSTHPLSMAICEYAKDKNISEITITNFTNIDGRGIRAESTQNETILLGNLALMNDNNIDTDNYNKKAENLSNDGKSIVFVAKNNIILGVIAIADTIKNDAKDTISKLKKMGIKTVLLTGDNSATANYIGKAVEFDQIVADVLPTEKANVVMEYQNKGDTVMMIGDGINDAPALTQADIGCAIGSGSEIAIESADIVLMKSQLDDVYKAIHLSRLTITNIKQNLFWAFCYNVLGIPIAAGVLYSSFNLLLSPMIGGIAMSLSSLFVVSNALRLKGKKI